LTSLRSTVHVPGRHVAQVSAWQKNSTYSTHSTGSTSGQGYDIGRYTRSTYSSKGYDVVCSRNSTSSYTTTGNTPSIHSSKGRDTTTIGIHTTYSTNGTGSTSGQGYDIGDILEVHIVIRAMMMSVVEIVLDPTQLQSIVQLSIVVRAIVVGVCTSPTGTCCTCSTHSTTCTNGRGYNDVSGTYKYQLGTLLPVLVHVPGL
jgi:hypothetical protein